MTHLMYGLIWCLGYAVVVLLYRFSVRHFGYQSTERGTRLLLNSVGITVGCWLAYDKHITILPALPRPLVAAFSIVITLITLRVLFRALILPNG